MLGKLLGLAINTALLPLDVVSDVVTMGGALSEDEQSAVAERLRRMALNGEDILDDLDSWL